MIKNWILNKTKLQNSPLAVGLSGAQGIGKSTLTAQLVNEFTTSGLKAVTLSIDDFYLTRSEQAKLSESTNNPYLQQRGYPGTHDVNLALKTLGELKAGQPTEIPRYDKSQLKGLGDRAPQTHWTKISEPLDIILFEGWFFGFTPQRDISDTHLLEVNNHLKKYQPLFNEFHELIYLKPKNLTDVISWRVEAEKNMRASGKEGMSDTEAEDYIKKFIPAYELYRESVNADLEILVNSDRSWEI